MHCSPIVGQCNNTLSFDGATNRINGFTYDAAGNLTNDGGYAYTYDAEGRLVTVTQGTTLLLTNIYDASGRVAEEQQPGCSAMHDYAFDPWGQRELDLWGWWNPCGFDALEWMGLPGGSQAFYNENNTRGTYFTHLDALGTATAMTGQDGWLWGQGRYYPFGQMWMADGYMATGQRYAGTEHRNPLGMDATQFRSYASAYGRWMTPDPLGGDITNPQSLNRYAYVENNPATLVDPLGLTSIAPCGANSHVTDCLSGGYGGTNPVGSSGSFDPCVPSSFRLRK